MNQSNANEIQKSLIAEIMRDSSRDDESIIIDLLMRASRYSLEFASMNRAIHMRDDESIDLLNCASYIIDQIANALNDFDDDSLINLLRDDSFFNAIHSFIDDDSLLIIKYRSLDF